MSSLLETVGTFVTSAIGWMGDFLSAITANNTGGAVLTTFVVAVPLVGLGIGLLKRLIHVRG